MPKLLLRHKFLLYMSLLGLATLILALILRFQSQLLLGSIRPVNMNIASIALNLESRNRKNKSKVMYHKDLNSISEVSTKLQSNEALSADSTYSIKTTNWYNDVRHDASDWNELKDKPAVQGLSLRAIGTKEIQHIADTRKMVVSQTTSVNEVHETHSFLDDFNTYPCLKDLPNFPPERWTTDGKCVRTVNITECSRKIFPDHKCVDVKTPKRILMPICVYPAEIDKWVSATILKGTLWESDLVGKMKDYMLLTRLTQPNIEFLDLGSNIGVYSLYLAQHGINVTAIEPLHSNMELIFKSILLGKVEDKIRLIWNAVSNNHKIVKFVKDTNNVGGTGITDINPSEYKGIVDVARTVTLDDLIPLFKGKPIAMKMDIESSEYAALLGGEVFFQEVDVKVVQIEFMFHRTGKHGPKIVDYFAKRGYLPFRDLQRTLLLNSYLLATWPNDIYFMKPAVFDIMEDPISNESVLL